MRVGSTPAVVLRAREFGESDKIVTVLSRAEGKFTGIAKGAKRSRRRFPGSLELFSHVRLDYRQKSETALCFLDRAVLIHPWPRLSFTMESYAAASHVVEIADKITADREVGDDLYALVVATLTRLDEREVKPTTLRLFELGVLAASGYRQAFGCCTRCRGDSGSDGARLRIPHSGVGILCPGCSEREPMGPTLSIEAARALDRCQRAVDRGLPGDGGAADSAACFVQDDTIDAAIPASVASEVRRTTMTLLRPHVRGSLRALELMGVSQG